MESTTAFNANGIEGDIARDGFRVYLEPEGIYFIRVGDLDQLSTPAQKGEYVGVSDRNLLLAFFVNWTFFFLPGKLGQSGGKDLLRKMEERPLPERLSAHPLNFLVRVEDVVSSAIRPGGGSFWRRGHGTWGLQLRDGRLAVLEFHSDLDRLMAQRCLATFLGDKLIIKGSDRKESR